MPETLVRQQSRLQSVAEQLDALLITVAAFPLRPDRDALRNYIHEIRLDTHAKFHQVASTPAPPQPHNFTSMLQAR